MSNFLGSARGTVTKTVNSVLGELGIVTPAGKISKNAIQNQNIDKRLRDIISTAAQRFPDYSVTVRSGYRPGDKRQHGKHRAIDINLVDKVTGRKLSDYQDAKTFRTYERFAQEARRVQQEKYPGLDKGFRWGGYFSGAVKNSILGTKGKYGAVDLMHFDLGGLSGLGMLGGSWAKGLTQKQRGLIPGAESFGIDHIDKTRLADVSDVSGLHSLHDRREYDRPGFAAPLGRVDRAPLSSVASVRSSAVPALDPNKDVFGGLHRPSVETARNPPGMSIPNDTASPRTMANLGGIAGFFSSLANQSAVAAPHPNAPVNFSTPKTDRLAKTATYADVMKGTPVKTSTIQGIPETKPEAIYDDPRALAYAQKMTPEPVNSLNVPGINPALAAKVTPDQPVAPIEETAPAVRAKTVQRARYTHPQVTVTRPNRVAVDPTAGMTLGGVKAADRFSVGSGLRGVTNALGGPYGATAQTSNRSVSVTSRGNLGSFRYNKDTGVTQYSNPAGVTTGVSYGKPGGFLGALGRSLGFNSGGNSKSGKSGTSGKSGSSGKSNGARGAAGGSLGQSQHSL